MPRISVPCSSILHKRMVRAMPWGMQAILVRRSVELLCEQIEKRGLVEVVNSLAANQFDPVEDEINRRKMKL